MIKTFTLEGFHAWLMETPNTEIDHESWPSCALGKFVMICEGLEPVTEYSSNYDTIEHKLTYSINTLEQLPEKLTEDLGFKPAAKEIAPTHLALANHIKENYL